MAEVSIVKDGILTGFGTLKDGTVKFTINCQEMTPEEAAKIFSLNSQYVKFFLTNKEITEEKITLVEDAKLVNRKKGKTKAQRLRGVIYILWEQSQTDLDFDTFYDVWMEKIIDLIKTKLD
jgi:hypothetical protein